MKLKKLIVLSVILVVTLLVCIATGFAESTTQPTEETDPAISVSIERFNLSFEDSIYVKYAVKLTGVESAASLGKENFRMLFWTAPQAEYTFANAESSSYNLGKQTIGGEDLYIFSYENLAAKQMTDNIYARAYAKVDGVEYYSDVEKYSVLQYAYNKLGYTGTATTDEDLKTLLTEMLAYGAAAQKYFDYNTDRLADARYYQVTVNGGTLPDGFDSGLYLAGETVTVTAPATDAEGTPFTRWEDGKGNVVSESRTYAVTVGTANVGYTAVYIKPSEGLAFVSNGNGTCYLSGIGTCTDTEIIIPSKSPNGDLVTAIGYQALYGCATVTRIVIPNTVTCIEDEAIQSCANLTSISLPDSVTRIGAYAMQYNSALQYNVYDNAYYLGNSSNPYLYLVKPVSNDITSCQIHANTKMVAATFSNCANLTFNEYDNAYYLGSATNPYFVLVKAQSTSIESCEINVATKIIANSAFDGCRSLTSITIPQNVTSIGWKALNCTWLTKITVAANNRYYKSVDGNLYTKDGTVLLQYAAENVNSDLVIPNGVTHIGENAFRNSSVTSVVLPEGVVRIESFGFIYSSSLTSIEIPSTLKSIGRMGLDSCSRLTAITLPEGFTSVGPYAFSFCSGLTSLELPSTVCEIGYGAFEYCSGLTSMVIPEGVTAIDASTFSNCSKLSSIVIPASVKSIDDYAFNSCSSLQTAYYCGTSSEWWSVDDYNNLPYSTTEYFYSETQPTTGGNYWHYVNGVPTKW